MKVEVHFRTRFLHTEHQSILIALILALFFAKQKPNEVDKIANEIQDLILVNNIYVLKLFLFLNQAMA